MPSTPVQPAHQPQCLPLSSDGQGPEIGGQAESRARTLGLLALLSGLAVLLNALPVPHGQPAQQRQQAGSLGSRGGSAPPCRVFDGVVVRLGFDLLGWRSLRRRDHGVAWVGDICVTGSTVGANRSCVP